ncbi:hypothetical protein B0F90DRAFT_1814107 [Multifurca ochricompacta]|uniref:Golgi apparatus membrane protein TVP38 n=1 Tax=Multifurca ochricompacta TaxID=376703 RepID=A0AAD4MCY5_9AGAM|nr:hypothetical protein B0F90DRAFT_1814107 [Multifurca ochricompacta]
MTGECTSQDELAFSPFLKHHLSSSVRRFRKLPCSGKLLIFAVILFYCALIALIIIIKPARLAQIFYDLGQGIRVHPLGWLLLATFIQIMSFPPMIGHTTMLNFLLGHSICPPAFPFGQGLRSWSAKNETWQALEAVIDAKGLPLIVLIRISPFPPWVYSNSLFASIQSVSVWQFIAATMCSFPRYLLYVFIGSRMASLSDGQQREKMDTQTKVVNGILIVAGILSGVAAGWILYALMKRQLKSISLASEVIEEVTKMSLTAELLIVVD